MSAAPVYVCPMHPGDRQAVAGKCPHCNMDLVLEGTRFGILRHMASSPLHIAVMVAVMLVLMGSAMMLMK
jgi:hypothetical protein